MKKILFLIQLPPPVHGASVINKLIQDSSIINNEFTTEYINTSPAKNLSDIGKFSPSKIAASLAIIARTIRSYLKATPDLVYITLSPHGLAFYKDGLIAIILKSLGGKLIFHMHGKGIRDESERSRLKRLIYRHIFKDVDIIHLAESLFYDVEDVRDKKKSITAIANGIGPFEEIGDTPKSKKLTFIYLSNLIRSKGADILVRAAGIIQADYQDRFQVKIIGNSSDTQYSEDIKQMIANNPYNNIKLLGSKYGQEKIRELASSHVFVLPTRFKNECFPLSILEAMAAGLAVISTNEGAIPEIIDHGITGDIIENCRPEDLAIAMIKYIENPEYSNSCAKAAKTKYDANYTLKIFEQMIVSKLKTLANQD